MPYSLVFLIWRYSFCFVIISFVSKGYEEFAYFYRPMYYVVALV